MLLMAWVARIKQQIYFFIQLICLLTGMYIYTYVYETPLQGNSPKGDVTL